MKEKKPSLIISLVPIFLLITLLSINVSLFGDNTISGSNQLTLLISAACAALLGLFYNVKYKEMLRIKLNGKTEVILADEISPDTCRLWDLITDKKLDKDRFRKNLGDLIPAYTEVAKRLGILHENSNVSAVNVTKLRSIKRRK